MSFLLDTEKQSDDYGDYYSINRVFIPVVSLNDSQSVTAGEVPNEVNEHLNEDKKGSGDLSVTESDDSKFVKNGESVFDSLPTSGQESVFELEKITDDFMLTSEVGKFTVTDISYLW
jgi:hypothetical protein